MKLRRALLSVSDKTGIAELAKALHEAGCEIVATGKTAEVVKSSGVPITPIEKITGNPEAFQGRMKTLSFPVFSGILYRRGNEKDEQDKKELKIPEVDCVVVNFYPFEKTQAIEEIDIGGPALVRAAAKNAPDVLVLTDPKQYGSVVTELKKNKEVTSEISQACARRAWERVSEYDESIAEVYGERESQTLRYGENPHQTGKIVFSQNSPIEWNGKLTSTELSYNNILDLSSAYHLMTDLRELFPNHHSVVIVKHNNPCGVAVAESQMDALDLAWKGDPVSAFGGVVLLSHELESDSARFLSSRFIELLSAPDLSLESREFQMVLQKRKNLKAVRILRFEKDQRSMRTTVPGGVLIQDQDLGLREKFECKTKTTWDSSQDLTAQFGILCTRTLKSNAVAIVRKTHLGVAGVAYQLVGAGQGQPNRIEAIEALAVPRAKKVLEEAGGKMEECLIVSDAFFPFRDAVDSIQKAGIKRIVQPGGSIKDSESIEACNEFGISMVFTGVRHFKH